MDTSEDNDYAVLQTILNQDEIAQINDAIRKKIENSLKAKFDEFITAKAVFETNRKNLELKVKECTKEFQTQKEEYQECQKKLDLTQEYISNLESQVNESKNELLRLHESVKRLEKENTELRNQKDLITEENNALKSQVDRRDMELERTKTELNSLGTQLQSAVAAKCQAFVDMEDIKSRELSLNYKEERLEQEKTLMKQQVASLEEELAKRTNELQNTCLKASSRALLTNTRLSQCEEDLKITNESLAQAREAYSALQRRCEELTQKLEDQRNHEISMHASYQEEVTAQTRLADLYKGMADEANAKSEDYRKAVKELQELLEEATEQYGILESKHNQTVSDYDNEILNKQTKIDDLTKELDHANELLKSIKQERLDQAVEHLAPTAAATSRIIKKGLSLTQIYSQLVEVTNELTLEKEENDKLKSQMEIILRELEEKAPILQQQREDCESVINRVNSLTLRLDELLIENNRLQEDADEAKRLSNYHTRENQRLKSELADLARQVCFLLKEVQEIRVGETMPSGDVTPMEITDLASSQIISKKLVTFKDIEELQENNQKLLSIVRALSSRQEEIEKATDEIQSGEMKKRLDRYIEQLAEMQEAQDRQAKMLENLLKQRDMYKNMYQECMNQSSVKDSSLNKSLNLKDQDVESSKDVELKNLDEIEKANDEIKNWHKKCQDAENRLVQINNDFENYKKEKASHEKLLNDEIERLRKDGEKNSTRCCRLTAQLDTALEQFKLLQGNVTSYKSQIKILEERCQNYSTTIGKHEHSIMLLKDETMSAQSRLAEAEVQLEHLKQERQLLRDAEGRLLKEREVLQRDRHTHALLKADVELIKISLERSQAEGQLRVEARLDDAVRECAALRRRLQEEQDRFRELSSSLERQLSSAKERLAEEKTVNERIQSELETSRQAEQEYRQKIDVLNVKVQQASSLTVSKPISGDENMSKRIKELEIQFASGQAEIKSLTDQLKAARFQSQQYCDIAEATETQLRENTEEFNKIKKELENNLTVAQSEIVALKNNIKQLEERLTSESTGHQVSDSDLKEKLIEAERKLEMYNELKVELETTKKDLSNSIAAASAAEDKYTREMMLHSADLQILSKLKEENQGFNKRISDLMLKEDSAKKALVIEKSLWKEREVRLYSEIKELQKKVEDLYAQNSLLHNQIQDLSERAVLNCSQNNPNVSIESMNVSFTEENSKSMEQLLQVIKYLRGEKDLVLAKFDVLKSENARLKAQTELIEKRFEEVKQALDREREKGEIDVVSMSKHSELLRKVETLNAITDSNRVLREERDSLNTKIKDLTDKLTSLSGEIVPLREKSRDLEVKNDALLQENSSLKGEATRWRQRANTLVERANKASPEDWRRLQTERENLSKLLTSERETHAKRMEELNSLKNDKTRLDEQVGQLQRQVQSLEEQASKSAEDARKLNQDLNDSINDSNGKAKDLVNLKKELTEKDTLLADIKNKEIQIRKIAKKYKTQYEELAKTMEEEKARVEDSQTNQAGAVKSTNPEDAQATLERESQLREEGRLELRTANDQLTSKVSELSQQVLVMQSESENLKKEIEIINKSSIEKEERAKQVLKGARTKIMQLTEYKKLCEKEMHELKEKLDTSASECESSISEYEARLAALKSQMEGRISRLEHERSDLQAEKETLLQRVAQLQRQLSGQSNVGTGSSEPPTANIKPMSARAETPLASIRPMSVVVQSRTAAVLPTTAGAPLLLAPQQSQQQQLVHTTETSSPTSSHMDYQPASTSRQLLVQPQLSESAESTQREEPEPLEPLSVQQQQQQSQQCQQQTVALVSPRVEQQQQQLQLAPPSDQQQTVPSSSTQSVSTSHTSIGHKRPRISDSSTSTANLSENVEHSRTEQISSPKSKRSRQQEVAPSTPASASDIEYQVPTSSQRDQDEEGEDGCVVVVACDEGGGTNQPQEEEEFDNDTYEEIEEEEELPYGVEVEGDNNEVEIIMEEDSTNVEVPRQIQSATPTNQQQSEAISSAGTTGEPSFVSRSSRGVPPMPRQQPQQHLLLPHQGYEDGGDDCIVPSTPTLFVPRRNDGFGEAVSSPQVPQGRFTFGDPSTPASASASPVQTQSTPSASGPRTMFGSSSSGLAQVMQEGMDDTRIDLTQLEEHSTGRSVPTTPQQVSPTTDHSGLVSSGPLEEQDSSVAASPEMQIHTDDTDGSLLPIHTVQDEEQEDNQIEISNESDSAVTDDNKKSEETGTSESASMEEDAIDTEIDVSEEVADEAADNDGKEDNREAEASPSSNTRQRTMAAAAAAGGGVISTVRGATARRSPRTNFRAARGSRPTPIIWDNSSSNRGQNVVRGHAARGSTSDGTRVRGTRGRRLRSKYPYTY